MTTVLYGPNVVAKQLLKSLSTQVEFASTTGGGEFEGKAVLNLQELAKKKHEVKQIIICSMFVDEIYHSLIDAGIELEKIFFYNPVNDQILDVASNLIAPIDEDDILYAIFDLSVHAAGFDADMFTICAECERQRQGKKYLQFVIVPKATSQDVQTVQNNHSKDELQWRLDHINIPYFKGLKSTIGVTQLAYREQVVQYQGTSVFPLDYSKDKTFKKISLPQLTEYKNAGFNLKVIEPNPLATDLIDKFCQSQSAGKPIVTLTMREYDSQSKRNNSKAPWRDFFNQLEARGFFPIIVRDTFKSTTPIGYGLDKYDCLPMASFDLTMRMALYQKAYVNFSVSCGPSSLFYYLKSCYSVAMIEYDEDVFTTSEEIFKKSGFEKGKQPIFAELGKQFIYWGFDDLASIEDAFAHFENNKIEG
ncbi:hypothetical protein [Pseudoalteromonas luteoviolacea]|uniref:Uncharacterized protein n=1 Tax=Pseudoalteromonas luteoviolacea S4060-1 TaxID=1365257 RepID=A0A167PGU9_9GAMM|nr:hypothetical protein [Pseudoalteromonas luteoviolacea]KZN70565.1 hypothetical protein N478_01255 [Pseudoalteromonas luteoviolacea S4060-1]